jgi:DinB superfamily
MKRGERLARDTAMDEETLRSLAAFPEELERHYSLIPAAYRSWTPASWEGVPSEALTAIEQVWHVLDVEVEGYYRRFQRTLAEDNPLLESLDTYALASERRYKEKDAGEALRAFRQARSKTVELLSGLRKEQLVRAAYFEGYGNVTLHGLIHFLCSHDQQHLSGLQWLLGKIVSR